MDSNAIDYGKMVMKNLHLSGVGVAKNYLLTPDMERASPNAPNPN